MGLKAPAPQNTQKRLKFFQAHPEIPGANLQCFNIKKEIIIRDYRNGLFSREDGNKKIEALCLEYPELFPKREIEFTKVNK